MRENSVSVRNPLLDGSIRASHALFPFLSEFMDVSTKTGVYFHLWVGRETEFVSFGSVITSFLLLLSMVLGILIMSYHSALASEC